MPRIHYDLEKTSVSALSRQFSNNASFSGTLIRHWVVSSSDPLDKVQNGTARLATNTGKPLAPGVYVLRATSDSDLPGMRPAGIGSLKHHLRGRRRLCDLALHQSRHRARPHQASTKFAP